MRAVILGGTGAIGGATAFRLARAGWDVDVTGRSATRMPDELMRAGVRFHAVERSDTAAVARLVGTGADLLVDLLSRKADHVRGLLPSMSSVACPILISTRAVYVDSAGRHVNGDKPAQFSGPLREDAPTVPPAPDDVDPFTREGYATCKVAAERTALDSGLPVTVLRPAKVHGRWARNPRTSWAIGRMLHNDPTIQIVAPHARDHLAAAANAAALIEAVAARPGPRILNCADPDTPTAEEIIRAIAGVLGWDGSVEKVAHDDESGQHPWRTNMTLDMTAACELGYRPVGESLDLLADEVRWVHAAAPRLEDRTV